MIEKESGKLPIPLTEAVRMACNAYMTSAFLYARISSSDQEDGVSLLNQEDRMRAFCLANGYAVSAFFSEVQSGGKANNRPQLQKALDAVCQARGVLVVYSLSRLARSVRDTLEISDRLEKAGANLASLNERIDTNSAIGKMVFRLLSTLNEFERDQLAERTASAMGYLRKKGKRISSRIPLGFDLSEDGETLVHNKQESEIVDQILSWRGEGESYSEIARRLRDSETPTKMGGKWYPYTVQSIVERQAKLAA